MECSLWSSRECQTEPNTFLMSRKTPQIDEEESMDEKME